MHLPGTREQQQFQQLHQQQQHREIAEHKMTSMRKLPMIVDVALDASGRNLYQIRDRLGNNAKEPVQFSSMEFALAPHGEHSAGPLLPTTADPPVGCRVKLEPNELLMLLPDMFDSRVGDPGSNSRTSSVSTPTSATSSSGNDDNIWSSDVQDAFEEILAMVPKKGLNKIKIAGRCCGRNELISDYILAKTNKFRSRKQVLSHIQVIKNMGQNQTLIRLINDGPQFALEAEAQKNIQHFEEIFSQINVNRSLGINAVRAGSALVPTLSLMLHGGSSEGQVRRHSLSSLALAPKRRRLPAFFVGVRGISFTIANENKNMPELVLTSQRELGIPQSLTVKENAAILNRFPGLEEFSNLQVPVLHNMVKLYTPAQLPDSLSIDKGLRTNYSLEFSGPANRLLSFTTVYSFGNEVLKVNEDDFAVNENQPFLLKFWKCFYLQILSLPTSLDAAFKGMTITQVIHDLSDTSAVSKNKIRAVLLWEFAKVDTPQEAVSSTSRIFLPPLLGYNTISSWPYSSSKTSIPAFARPPDFPYSAPLLASRTIYGDVGSLASDFHSNHPVHPALHLASEFREPPQSTSTYQDFSFDYNGQTPSYFSAPADQVLPSVPGSLAHLHPLANVDLLTVKNNVPEEFYGGNYFP